jgi:hypothetical protein
LPNFFDQFDSTDAINPKSRDLAIRTIYGEAGDQPDIGKAAVAAVIANRATSGKYGGKDVAGVVMAPNQFEPWQRPDARQRMMALAPDSPDYQKIAAIFDGVINKDIEDPTNGATHFFSPGAQAALGRKPPSWAQGEGQQIGGHMFFAPDDRKPAKASPISPQAGNYFDQFDEKPQSQPSPPSTVNPETGKPLIRVPVYKSDGTEVPTDDKGRPDRGALDAGARGVAQGLTANFGDEIRGLVEASGANPDDPASVYKLISGALKYFSGDQKAKESYDTAVARERELNKAAEEQHPVASIAGNIGGAVLLPIGAGAGAVTLPGRIAAGAGTGAVLGGAAGAGEGTNAVDRISRGAVGAAAGGVLGGAAPVAIEGAVRGARAISQPIVTAVRGIRDSEGEAARRVAIAIQRDANIDPQAAGRLTPQEFAASAQSGGPATIMDMGGETTRALARSAANTSPEGRDVLNRTISDRFEGQGNRVVGWLRNTFHYPDAHAQEQALTQTAQTTNRSRYTRAFQDGDRQIISPEIERLIGSPAVAEAMRRASTSGKDRAITQGYGAFNPGVTVENGLVRFRPGKNGAPTYPNLAFWDATKRELDDAAQAAARAGRNGEASTLGDLARSLRTELDTIVPSYQAARAGAAHFFGAQDALEAGRNFVTAKMGNAEARQHLARMTPTERQLFQDGFVSQFINHLSEISDRRSILNKIGDTPAARERLNMVLGRQRAEELEAGLRVEGIMDLARPAVQGNSTTARQLAELGLAGGTYGIGTGGNITNPNPSALMNAALVYGAARGKNRVNENVSRRVAELLASNDPARLVQGIRLVVRNQNLFNSLRSTDRGLARIGGEQAPVAPALQAAGVARADDQPDVPRPPGQ